jgi:hypothetical protein
MQLFLYVINVYQPCTAKQLRDLLHDSSIEWLKEITADDLRGMLKKCEEQQYILRTSSDLLYLTYMGLRFVSQLRIAFTRDKNRLFYLKDVLGKRRDRV